MKLLKLLTAFFSCLSALVLMGCQKNKTVKPQILDGPGMEYIPKWSSFDLSSSGSYAQDNFWFTVEDPDGEPTVAGECRDEEGNLYTVEEPIYLPEEVLWQLRRLNLEKLDNVKTQELEETEDLIILDGSSLSLTITLTSGETVRKCVTFELAKQIYEILVPVLKNNQ